MRSVCLMCVNEGVIVAYMYMYMYWYGILTCTMAYLWYTDVYNGIPMVY